MSSQRINIQRISLAAGAISLFIVYMILWGRMITSPTDRTGTDFIAFYAAGRVAEEYGSSHAYDIALQQKVQEKEVGFQLSSGQALLYNHMPYLIPVLQILVNQNYMASFARWTILLLAVYAAGFWGLVHWFPADWDTAQRRRFFVGAISFFPCFASLLLGQDTAFLFLGVALLGWGISDNRDWLAGVGLALVTVRPHISILLALPFLFSRRGILWWFLGIAGSLAVTSIAILGIEGTKDFIDVLFISAAGEWYGMKEIAMYNLIGLLARSLPLVGAESIRLVGWTVYLAAIPALCCWAACARKMDIHSLSVIILVSLLVVPHLHFHDLALFLFPLLTASLRIETGTIYRGIQSALQPMIISLLLLFSSFHTTILHIWPFLIMLALFILAYRRHRIYRGSGEKELLMGSS